jgi:hypothetical protein
MDANSALICEQLNICDDQKINLMRFAYGIFLVRLLLLHRINLLVANEIIRRLNAANSEDAILAVTVNDENSIWHDVSLGTSGKFSLSCFKGYKKFVQPDGDGITIESKHPIYALLCCCYGSKAASSEFRDDVDAFLTQNGNKTIIDFCEHIFIGKDIDVPFYCSVYATIKTNAIDYENTTKIPSGLVFASAKPECIILHKFIELTSDPIMNPCKRQVEKNLQETNAQMTTEAINRHKSRVRCKICFAVLISLGVIFVVGGNIIAWLNLLSIASTVMRIGITAIGITIGAALLLAAFIFAHKKDILPQCKLYSYIKYHYVYNTEANEVLIDQYSHSL